MSTPYDWLLPVAKKLTNGLNAKPGVHFADKEIVSNWIAQVLNGMIERGELVRQIDLADFLKQHASGRFRTITELAEAAKAQGILGKNKPQKAFVPILESWMKQNPNNFWAEIYAAGHGRLKVRFNNKNCGLIRYRG